LKEHEALSTTGGFQKLKDNMGWIQKLPTQDRSPKNNHGKDSKRKNIPIRNLAAFKDKVAYTCAPLLSIEALKIIIL
jgi:hypothetical protein